MKHFIIVALILSTAGLGIAKKKKSKEPPLPPACVEEEEVIQSYQQQMNDLVAKVKGETRGEFERNYHQKTAENFLTFWSLALDTINECYDKALQEATRSEERKAKIGRKKAVSVNQITKIKESEAALKRARRPRKAKVVIEAFNFTDTDAP